MRDPKYVMNPAIRFARVLLGQGNTLLKAGGNQALNTAKGATPYGLLLSLGGSTDQKNNWSRLGYASKEDYNNAIAAHKADQIANPQNYDPEALQYQAEFDNEGDKPFLNKVFSNLFSKSSEEFLPIEESSPTGDPYIGMSTKISDKPIDTYEQFVERTQNSPAMRAGVFDPKDLYQTYISNQDFQVAKDTGNLEDFAREYPQSQTAKQRGIGNRGF